MRAEDVKSKLLQIEECVADFTVVLSGKSSKKVHGLYKLESAEIIIHNRNFTDDNALMYTAIHEYAHHLHFTDSDETKRPSVKRSHTIAYRTILHRLLGKAQAIGVYQNVFGTSHEFQSLTKKIKDHYLVKNGQIMKDFGKLLLEAMALCEQNQVNFDDYVERELSLHRTQAQSIMRVYALDVDPHVGFENMKIISSVRDSQKRAQVQEMLTTGQSQDQARAFIRENLKSTEIDPAKSLAAEKRRIEKRLEQLQKRLQEIDAKLLHNTQE
jgi:hypothetical protein